MSIRNDLAEAAVKLKNDHQMSYEDIAVVISEKL